MDEYEKISEIKVQRISADILKYIKALHYIPLLCFTNCFTKISM